MKILKRDINGKTGEGFIYLIPEDEEDLFYLYTILLEGDAIRSKTSRKVQIETKTGSITSQKKIITLQLQITKIEYYLEKEHIELVIKGKSMIKNEFINQGQFHNISIQLNQPLSIIKNRWEPFHIQQLKESTTVEATSDLAAFVMEEGVAHLCYIRNNTTVLKGKVQHNVPKKKSLSQHSKARQHFFSLCFNEILKIDFEKVKAIVIASPGFVKDEFFQIIQENCQKEEFSKLKQYIPKFLLVHSSNGYLDALNEVLQDEQIKFKLKDTKALSEIKALEQFYEAMKNDPDKVAYGPKYVIEASQNNVYNLINKFTRLKAISTLLISDNLFRSKEFEKRKIYNSLVEELKTSGGEVIHFSSFHQSGEKLNNLGGIASILRFPLNLDYLDDDENDEKENENISADETEEIDEEEKQKQDYLWLMAQNNDDFL